MPPLTFPRLPLIAPALAALTWPRVAVEAYISRVAVEAYYFPAETLRDRGPGQNSANQPSSNYHKHIFDMVFLLILKKKHFRIFGRDLNGFHALIIGMRLII